MSTERDNPIGMGVVLQICLTFRTLTEVIDSHRSNENAADDVNEADDEPTNQRDVISPRDIAQCLKSNVYSRNHLQV